LDKVDSITLTGERESSYRWFPEIPAKEKSFMGIKYGMTEAIPAGWNEYIDDDGNEYRPWNRKQSSYFDDYKWYRVDDVNKKVCSRAHVEIRLGYKQSFGVNFESTEAAQAYVDDLILGSDKKFTVIINK
jgi:hypothetical protein